MSTLRRTVTAETKVKPKRCKASGCGSLFFASRPFQTWCSPDCGYAIAQAKTAKALEAAKKIERAKDKVKRESLKTRRDWINDAQRVFNAYIRQRDANLPCICCGAPLWVDAYTGSGGQYDCGHYRSVGSAPHLRFDERNAHGQRKVCNRYGAGRAVDYRIGLIARIGLAAVESLESDQSPRHHTIDDLKQIIATYRAKTKELLMETV